MIRRLAKPGIIVPNRGVQRPLWPFAPNKDSMQWAGLVGWWPSCPENETTLYDVSGNGLHGTFSGMITVAQPEQNMSAFNNGTSTNYVSVPDNELLNPSLITVAAWVRPITSFSTFHHIASKPVNTTWTSPFARYFLRLGTTGANGRVNFWINNGTASADSRGINAAILGQANHVAGTYDGVTIRGYLNGIADGTASLAGTIASSTQPLTIGNEVSTNPGQPFNGYIADLRIYNRALSAAEVWQLYDPRTRWQLYAPLRQRVFSFPVIEEAPPPPSTPDIGYSRPTATNTFVPTTGYELPKGEFPPTKKKIAPKKKKTDPNRYRAALYLLLEDDE